MKKKHGPTKQEKKNDKDRLIALTKDSYDGKWICGGIALPEHICHYQLGVYYEVDNKKKGILIEYYMKGELIRSYYKDMKYMFGG